VAFTALVHSRDKLKSSENVQDPFAAQENMERAKRQSTSSSWVTGPFSAVSSYLH